MSSSEMVPISFEIGSLVALELTNCASLTDWPAFPGTLVSTSSALEF